MRENVYATVAGLGLGTGLGTLFFGQIFVGSLLVLGSATLGMWVIERNKSS